MVRKYLIVVVLLLLTATTVKAQLIAIWDFNRFINLQEEKEIKTGSVYFYTDGFVIEVDRQTFDFQTKTCQYTKISKNNVYNCLIQETATNTYYEIYLLTSINSIALKQTNTTRVVMFSKE